VQADELSSVYIEANLPAMPCWKIFGLKARDANTKEVYPSNIFFERNGSS
jgi:hypothetical protein